jgi:hypothetical protein
MAIFPPFQRRSTMVLFQLVLFATVSLAIFPEWREGLDYALVGDLPAPTPQPIDELRLGPAYSSPTRGHSKERLLGRESRLDYRQVCPFVS